MRRLEWEVLAGENGERLDVYLSRRAGITRSRGQKLIVGGKVEVDGRTVPKHHRLRTGERVSVILEEPEPAIALPQDIPVRVVYQDRDIAVVSKPPGLVVHPAAGHRDGTLVNALLNALPNLSGVGGVLRPGIVHRLDKDTSGLMVVAKNDRAHLRLGEMVKTRELKRFYLCLVHGIPPAKRGTVDAPIARNPCDRKKMAVVPEGRPSRTHFRVLETFPPAYSLLEVELETGRTHQIRVHLSFAGHPVAGDTQYGRKGGLERKGLLQRQFLHAHRLIFPHPSSGEKMEFIDPLPPDLSEVLEKLRSGHPL